MQLSHRVALNGIQMDEIDPRIIIQGVSEGAAKINIAAQSLMGRDGQRISQRRRDMIEVSVRFCLRIGKRDMAERSELFEKIAGWANGGGILTLNYRPGRQIRVVCAQLPEAGDPWIWNQEYSILFRAYGIPCWTQDAPTSATTGTAQVAGCSLLVEGTAESRADVILRNMSGAAIGSVSISIGGKTMNFSGLDFAGGEQIEIDHTEEDFLRIRIRGAGGTYRSILDRRSESSADDFAVRPGIADCAFSAQRACQMSVSCRGRYA